MNIEDLSIKDQVKFLNSQLVLDKIGRMMHGGVWLNDEFILTIGEAEFNYLVNCEADNIEFGNRVGRKYTTEQQIEYTKKLVSLGFLSPATDECIVYMDKVREFFNSCTDKHPKRGSELVDEYIQEMIRFS